jgi:intraflagellar transport protein 74
MRPDSRGGAPMGGGMQGGMRPGTGMRQPPGTGMRQPPGTGMRMTTAQRAINTNTVGLNANMSAFSSDRPVTQQGLSGMKTAGMGPSRTIQDNSYYLGLLRAKCTEIMKEIEVLKGNVDQGQKDNAAYGQLERKYESLTNDMRALQGSLADYNLLLDRSRAHRDVDEVLEEAQHLAQANHGDRGRVDELFQHRSAIEGQCRDVEAQLSHQHEELAAKLEQLDPSLKDHFVQLSQKEQALSLHEIPKRMSDLAFFDERVREMEAAVSRDPLRAKAFRLREDMMRLERKHAELSQELDGPQLSEEQQREVLLARVKADNAQIAEHERTLAESQEAIRAGKKQLAQLKTDAAEANDPKAQKVQELYQRDKEMSELIDNFEPTKAEETRKIEKGQEETVRLLQSISRRLALADGSSGMSKEKLDEMHEDLGFKQSQMDHSISTSERLTRELGQRKVELDKIESLDEKIGVELAQLSEKQTAMESELAVYEDLPKLRDEAEQAKAAAIHKKGDALSRIGDLKARAAKEKKAYEALKAKREGDDVAVALEELEQKMRHHEQTVYVLSEYIETKGAESHFEGIAEECMQMIGTINSETITALKERPVFSANMQPY